MRNILLTGLVGGLLIAALSLFEYRHLVRAYPGELYGGLVALVFTGLGLYFGRQLRREAQRGVPRAVVDGHGSRPLTPGSELPTSPVDLHQPAFAAGESAAVGVATAAAFAAGRALGITPREHEILLLIAEGLSNREIGERVFISENTVKTHSSRLFEKLGVRRRVQAVQRARALGLLGEGSTKE